MRYTLFPCNLRITPAHAGKTLTEFFMTIHDEDHPRSRGENFTM